MLGYATFGILNVFPAALPTKSPTTNLCYFRCHIPSVIGLFRKIYCAVSETAIRPGGQFNYSQPPSNINAGLNSPRREIKTPRSALADRRSGAIPRSADSETRRRRFPPDKSRLVMPSPPGKISISATGARLRNGPPAIYLSRRSRFSAPPRLRRFFCLSPARFLRLAPPAFSRAFSAARRRRPFFQLWPLPRERDSLFIRAASIRARFLRRAEVPRALPADALFIAAPLGDREPPAVPFARAAAR